MPSIVSEESVLKAFYEERKSRGKVPKRHSLLQKNLSYFSTNPEHNKENVPNYIPSHSSSKHIHRKKILDKYETNLKQITADLSNLVHSCQPSYSRKRQKLQTKQSIISQEPSLNIESLVKQNRKGESVERENKKISSPESHSLDKLQGVEEYHSPKFNEIHQDNIYEKGNSRQIVPNNTAIKYTSDSSIIQEPQVHNTSEIEALRKKVEELEKINKKQTKFIDSIYKMRRTIDHVQDDCSLKQLWRWVKALPN